MADWSYQRLDSTGSRKWYSIKTSRRIIIVTAISIFAVLSVLAIAHPRTRSMIRIGQNTSSDDVDVSIPPNDSTTLETTQETAPETAPETSPETAPETAPETSPETSPETTSEPETPEIPETPTMHDPVPQFGPPTYDWLRQWEKNLPQHDLELPAPEGKNGRYVKFTNQIKMLGWNNCLAEMLMNAHLAYASGRAYVFQDYFWEPSHYPWPKEQQLEYPPRTPLTALISGPTAGGPWESGDEAPRSISSDWFDVVCPPENRRIINTREVKPQVKDAPGSEVFEAWKKVLAEAPEGCLEIQPAEEDFFSQTFDMFLWITPRIVSLWDNFSNSPTSRLLDASPIVRSAVERNEYLFMPRGNSAGPYERMLAMHLRRGDYDEHCKRLARENQTFYGWNHLTFLPDPFIPPPGNAEDPENVAIYMRRCYPTFAEVVQKVHDARSEYLEERRKRQLHTPKTLDILYLLTNEKGSWLEDLMDALHEDGWDTIRTSKDLILDQEQTDVGMAADMEIARRAAVFIGNGWSSMSSNIVHKRLVDEKIPKSNRFL